MVWFIVGVIVGVIFWAIKFNKDWNSTFEDNVTDDKYLSWDDDSPQFTWIDTIDEEFHYN